MADPKIPLSARIAAAVPYVLPVIGGAGGMLWVNTHRMEFLSPVFWIPLGVFIGWLASRVILALMSRRW